MTKALSKPNKPAARYPSRRAARRAAEKIHEPLPASPAKPETADDRKLPDAIYGLTQYSVKRTAARRVHCPQASVQRSGVR